MSSNAPPPDPLPTITGYRILEVLGEGGMGTVYKAEQQEPVRRLVAIKVIKLGMDSKEVVSRFDLERRALAAMGHRAIAKVFAAGTTSRGQPYFVMELVEGLPLIDYCDKHRLTIPERIDIFRQVCAGVQHAHQKGVIHRDLKPGNIVVAREGNDAVPKILDFGLAMATNRDLLAQSIHTERDRMLGTPEYMAPEQAAADDESIDTRADIYSLGVVLYEMLSGELPFPSDELRRAGWLEIQRKLQEDEPPKPSTRISTIGGSAAEYAKRRRISAKSLSRELRGDLDWIVLKAMAKEPERRYDSATGLSMDLQRYIDHDPVVAGPPSALYRLRKLARRYRTQVTAAAIVLVAMVAGTIGTTWFMLEAQRHAASAEDERDNARTAEIRANRESQRFRRLALGRMVRDADQEQAQLYPAWPRNVRGLEAWLEHWQPILQGAPKQVEEALDELAAMEAKGTATEWDKLLRKDLRNLRDTLAEFLQDGGQLDTVRWRASWAAGVEGLTRNHRGGVPWDDAIEAIHAEHGIELREQIGLVPIGMNPKTGLWEFYHLRSAYDPRSGDDPEEIEIPEHDGDGWLTVRKETGIVFVLIPGGSFTDSQGTDETVAPFFLARHELTQAQWMRLSLHEQNPSRHEADDDNLMHSWIKPSNPVEQVNWKMSTGLMRQHGLRLPSENEWEYGCRAGTTTAWSCGDDMSRLEGHANVLDADAKQESPHWADPGVRFADSHVLHAPVGSFQYNKWGLHDMHGNVAEWCSDPYTEGEPERVVRGGGFSENPAQTQSSARNHFPPSTALYYIGLRPARSILERD